MNPLESASNDPFFRDCYSDLESQRANLTATQYTWAETTIQALEILFKEKVEIASILDEKTRNEKITEKTGLIAEPGLLEGTTVNEVKKAIDRRVKECKKAYYFDKEQKETFLFFREAFLGPPCFNGRVITLQHYILERQNIQVEGLYEYKSDCDEAAAHIEECLHEYMETSGSSKKDLPSLEKITQFIVDSSDRSERYYEHLSLESYRRACQFYRGVAD